MGSRAIQVSGRYVGSACLRPHVMPSSGLWSRWLVTGRCRRACRHCSGPRSSRALALWIAFRVDCLIISSSETHTSIQTVGFIGLGAMGDPMSAQIAQAGFRTVVYDAKPGFAQELAEDDLRVPGSVASVASSDAGRSDASQQRRRRVGAAGGRAAGGDVAGQILIDMSSSDPRRTVALGERTAAQGIAFADAPVSGGVAKARTGELTTIVGAEDDLLERIRTLLDRSCREHSRSGGLGAGHAAKALNNLLSATGLLIATEAVEAGARFGIDPHTLVELINVSTGMNHATKTKIEQYVLSQRFDSGFKASLMLKDLRLAGELCQELGIGTGLAAQVVAEWASACDQLPEGADQTEIALVTSGKTRAKAVR